MRSGKFTFLSVLLFVNAIAFGQQDKFKGWHLLDDKTDTLHGISIEKTYEFLKNKKSKPVIVAVIDSGVDTTQEDLKNVLWKNPKEIAGDGIDEDGNGYIDDVYGWNFLGGKDGRNIKTKSLLKQQESITVIKPSLQINKSTKQNCRVTTRNNMNFGNRLQEL